MKRFGSEGFIGGVIVVLIAVSLVAIGALVFAFWAYNGRQLYKNHADSLVSTAVQNEKTKEDALLQQQFKTQSEQPFVSYTGPSQYGSVNVQYPKNWSGYVDDTGSGGNPLDAYFDPGVVPAIGGPNSIFALRVEVNSNSYSTQLATYTQQQQNSNLTITPYTLKRVPNVYGVMIKGAIQQNKQGTLVMFPLRTDTLEIWTESSQYANQFVSQLLPLVTFKP